MMHRPSITERAPGATSRGTAPPPLGSGRGASPLAWPERAFAHPLWWLALIALIANDHVLKGSGALPAALTGKLSDVAGLLVAPLVLAWLLRARTQGAFLACHVAVGVGFALVQVDVVAANIEDGARALGLAVRSWADPSDLFCLPALLASFFWFGPSSGSRSREGSARAWSLPAWSNARASLTGLFALVFCTATLGNDGDPAPRYPFPPAGILSTDVFIRHVAGEDIQVKVRRLLDERDVDCDLLLDGERTSVDGQPILNGDDFGEEREWNLARGDAVPLWDRRGGAVDRACYAVRLKARDHEWLVTWRHGAPALHDIDIRLDMGVPAEDDAMGIANEGQDPPSAPEGVTIRPVE